MRAKSAFVAAPQQAQIISGEKSSLYVSGLQKKKKKR